MTLAEIWDICTQFMWDESYVSGLDTFLREHGIRTILDVAGGTGFPSIDLKKRGWDVCYADGSPEMVDLFRKKVEARSLQIPTCNSNWSELEKKIPSKFDVVLCRGNSLVYVDSWDGGQPTVTAEQDIRNALTQFYMRVNDGGLIYVDIFSSTEFDHKTYPFIEEFGQREINGMPVSMRWKVDHKPEVNLRVVKIRISKEGQAYEHNLYSYLLRQEDLVKLMANVGFKNIQQTPVAGESHYTVFTARR